MREIGIIEAAIIVVVFLVVLYIIAGIQKWWYKNHPYVNKDKLSYEEMKERWEETLDNKDS